MAGTMPGPVGLGPFFPEPAACGPLLERAAALAAEGHRLEATHGALASALRPVVRTMNACHASVLDGRPLRPAELEPATGVADAARDRARQLARAHHSAEMGLLAALPTKSVGLYAPEFVQCIHAELHRACAPSEAMTGDEASMPSDAPGAWRTAPTPGRAAAPAPDIPDLLDTWQGVYSKPYSLEQAVLSAVCAQHRLLWVRPFAHGNGRSARLHTLLVLTALGLTQGVWSPLRGMARARDDYQARLRRTLTGPGGPLAREAALRRELESFATWLLDICLDEASTARELLDAERLKARLADLLAWLGAHPWVMGSEKSVIKPDALEALHYAAITGPVERARFIAMLGLQHRTGRRVLSSLLDFGLLASESSRAPVRFQLPLASLRFLFPGAWPETESAEPPHTSAHLRASGELGATSDAPPDALVESDAEAPPAARDAHPELPAIEARGEPDPADASTQPPGASTLPPGASTLPPGASTLPPVDSEPAPSDSYPPPNAPETSDLRY